MIVAEAEKVKMYAIEEAEKAKRITEEATKEKLLKNLSKHWQKCENIEIVPNKLRQKKKLKKQKF